MTSARGQRCRTCDCRGGIESSQARAARRVGAALRCAERAEAMRRPVARTFSAPTLRCALSRLALLVAFAAAARGAAGAPDKDQLLASSLSDCGGGVNVLRSAAWPGGGVQLTFSVGWAELAPASPPNSSAPLPSVKLNGISAAVTPAPQQAGLTAVLVVPGPLLDSIITAVQALVESLPPLERVAIWYLASTGDTLLVADFTNRCALCWRCAACVGRPA